MKNRIEQYKEIERTKIDEVFDKNLAKDLSRADDDGFANSENSFELHSRNRDTNMWQHIKANSSRLFRNFFED